MPIYLVKAVILPFYRRHAVFFGVLIFTGIGFLSGHDQVELGKALLASLELQVYYCLLTALWTVYLLYWLRQLLRQAEQQLTSLLILFPRLARNLYLLELGATLLFFQLLYGIFLLAIGVSNGQIWSALVLFSWTGALLAITGFFIYRRILRPGEAQPLFYLQAITYAGIFARYFWRSNRWASVLMIGFSLVFWWGCLALSSMQAYDARFLYVMGLVLAGLQLPLLQGLSNFEKQWQWMRQLPMPRWKYFLNEGIIFVLILLPEVVLCMYNTKVVQGTEAVILSVLLLFSLRSLTYYYQQLPVGLLAALFILYFFLIMYQFPFLLLLVPLVGISYLGYWHAWLVYDPPVQEN